jgi:hypothetical protein
LDEFFGSPWVPLLEVDILQLAGLSLMILGPVKQYVRGPWLVVAAAAVVASVAPLLWGRLGSPVLDPLWGTGEWVSFPLFPWLAYPLLGLALARFTTRSGSASRLLRAWALTGAALIVVRTLVVLFAPDAGGMLAVGDYFRSDLPIQLVLAGFVLVWLPFLWWLDRRLAWRAVPRYLTSLSRNITAIYLIQWVLIGWLAIALGVFDQPSWLAALLCVPILVVSHLLALGYGRLTPHGRAASRTRSSRPGPPSSPR